MPPGFLRMEPLRKAIFSTRDLVNLTYTYRFLAAGAYVSTEYVSRFYWVALCHLVVRDYDVVVGSIPADFQDERVTMCTSDNWNKEYADTDAQCSTEPGVQRMLISSRQACLIPFPHWFYESDLNEQHLPPETEPILLCRPSAPWNF